MSKLSDRLKEVSSGVVRPLGFGLSVPRPQSLPLLLVALMDSLEQQIVSQVVKEGAEVVLAPAGPVTDEKTLKAMVSARDGALWGGVLEAGGRDEIERLERAGCDVVLLRSGALAADTLIPEKVDKLLEVDPAWPDILVRGLGQLPVAAAVFRIQAGETMSIQQLLQCQRIVGLAQKPILVTLPPTVGTEALALLRDAGVSGVMVAPGMVKDFRTALKELPPRKPRERPDAVLPIGLLGSHEESEEDEEDRGTR